MRGGGRGIDDVGWSGGWAERGRGFEGWLLVKYGLNAIKREMGKGTYREIWGLCRK